MAKLDPRGMVGRINKEEINTLLHTKYENSGPCGLREEDFLCISHYKPIGANDPGVGPFLSPGAWLAGLIKRPIKHCYTQNMKTLGLVISEKKILFMFFQCRHRSVAPMDPYRGPLYIAAHKI